MKKALLTIIAICNFLFLPLLSKSTLPNSNEVRPPVTLNQRLADLKIKDFQKMIGRKLTLKEKISFFLLKKTAHFQKHKSGLGTTSLLCAIGGVVFVLLTFALPPLGLVGIGLCIAAIITGAVAKKKNPEDVNGIIGFWMGLTTLFLVVALMVIAVATYDGF